MASFLAVVKRSAAALNGATLGQRATSSARSRQSVWERLTGLRPDAARPASRDGNDPARRDVLRAIVRAYSLLRVDRVDLPGADVRLRITRPLPPDFAQSLPRTLLVRHLAEWGRPCGSDRP